MSAYQILRALGEKMNGDPTHIEGLDGVLQFDIKGEETLTYQVVFSNGSVSLMDADLTTPLCTLQLSDENFVKLMNGKLNATSAVFTGKLKVKGDLGFALKIQSVLPKYVS